MDEPDLLHPELRSKGRTYLVLRSAFFTRYFFPAEERISWYGDMIRADGSLGMYATDAQHAAWPRKQSAGDISIGPG